MNDEHKHDDCIACLQRRVRELERENEHVMGEYERLASEVADLRSRLADSVSVTEFHKGNGI